MPAPRKPSGQAAPSLVEDLAALAAAQTRAVDNFANIKTYYKAADLLLRQADTYRRSQKEKELYVMLLRYAGTVVEVLPRHRAFDKADPKYLKLRENLAKTTLPELEALKIELNYRDKFDKLAGDEEGYFAPTKTAGTMLLSAGNLPEIHWEDSLAPPPPPPAAGAALGVPQPEGFDLLSSLGVGGPAASSSSSGAGGGVTLFPGQPAVAAAAALPSLASLTIPPLNSSLRLPAASQATLAKHALLPAGSFGSRSGVQPPSQQAQRLPALPQRPLYPELAELEPPAPPPQQGAADAAAALASLDVSSGSSSAVPAPQGQAQGPQLPAPSPYGELQLGPQQIEVGIAQRPTQPLPPDATCCQPGQQQQAAAVVPARPSNGGVSEVKKLQQIRDVHVSVALMDEFMRYAVSNTRRGIESCGILAGVLSPDDALFTITTLIVPKQVGTSDTVEMLNEEEIFEAQDSRALYPLGWIHTHPTQTCFLSSVDIHTHCGFQTMLDEAVAIVMAPKDPTKRVGIFRLSTPGGVKLVQRCPHRGFHPHPPTETGQPLYELCSHVYLNPRVKYEVIDLRK